MQNGDDNEDSDPGHQLGEDDDTPVDPRPRRVPSTAATQTAYFTALIDDFGKLAGELSGQIDRLPEDERRVRFKRFRREARATLKVMWQIVGKIR